MGKPKGQKTQFPQQMLGQEKKTEKGERKKENQWVKTAICRAYSKLDFKKIQ